MRARLYYHIVWTTRDRRPLLDRSAAVFLGRYLRAVARQERSRVLALGIVTTHVHVLVAAAPVTDLPRLVQRFKGGSSVLINREHHTEGNATVRWEKGYAIHTVGSRGLDAARAYVQSQDARHPDERIPGWRDDTRQGTGLEPAGAATRRPVHKPVSPVALATDGAE